jgi:carboxyl-terminal processing protease
MHIREADLERHLSNDKEKEATREQARPEIKQPAKTPAKPGKDKNKEDSEDDLPPRLEYATPADYQFQQAVNLLKGLQIMQNKTKD